MALVRKVKTALDETRTLILGAQILLGFQFQGTFQERFETLPPASQNISAVALALMLLVTGLLIAPSAFHRIAESGESTGRILFLTGRLAALALLPFAIALGLDITITLERAWGHLAAGAIAGTLFTALATVGWYGMGFVMRRRQGAAERGKALSTQEQREATPLPARIEQMLTEARVILPGAQALLGFQLVIVLSGAFEKLPDMSRLMHGLALLCVALSVILLMTPAALHRIVWSGEDSEILVTTGGHLTVLALLPLALGMSGDAYVVLARITGTPVEAAAAAAIVLLFLLGLWFAWPSVDRMVRTPRANKA